jgi:hypothetical protein
MAPTEKTPYMDREWVRELQEKCWGDGEFRWTLYCVFELGRETGEGMTADNVRDETGHSNPFSVRNIEQWAQSIGD